VTTGCSKRSKTDTPDNSGLDTYGTKTDLSAWMKTNGISKGGTLIKDYCPACARYFVKYVFPFLDSGAVGTYVC